MENASGWEAASGGVSMNWAELEQTYQDERQGTSSRENGGADSGRSSSSDG